MERMLQALQFTSIKQRLYYSVCVFIYKMLNNMLPVLLRDKFVIVGNENQRLTRQAGNMLEFRKTRSAQKNVFYEGVKIYNCQPMIDLRHLSTNFYPTLSRIKYI